MLVLARTQGFNARTCSVLGILVLDPSLRKTRWFCPLCPLSPLNQRHPHYCARCYNSRIKRRWKKALISFKVSLRKWTFAHFQFLLQIIGPKDVENWVEASGRATATTTFLRQSNKIWGAIFPLRILMTKNAQLRLGLVIHSPYSIP